MLKRLGLLIIVCMFLMPMSLFANSINVSIDGDLVQFQNQSPVIIDGRTLVPVADVFRALDFNVQWNGETQQVTLARSNDEILITLGSNEFVINGTSHNLDVPAQIINGSTMLPIAPLLRAVGYEVNWNGNTSTVAISSSTTIISANNVNCTNNYVESFNLVGFNPGLTATELTNIRTILGVDFTIENEERVGEIQLRRFSAYFLELQGVIDTTPFRTTERGSIFGTEIGDAFLFVENGIWSVFIDIGGDGARREYAVFRVDMFITEAEFNRIIDLSLIRDLLGVNFSVHQSGHFRELVQFASPYRWHNINLYDEINTANFEFHGRGGNIFGTKTGDVLLVNSREGWELLIDIGGTSVRDRHYSAWVFGSTELVERQRIEITETTAEIQISTPDISIEDTLNIRELLGTDFTVQDLEYSRTLPDIGLIRWHFLDLSNILNISRFSGDTSSNIINSQIGDVLLVYLRRQWHIYIDIGADLERPETHRRYFVASFSEFVEPNITEAQLNRIQQLLGTDFTISTLFLFTPNKI